MLVVCMWFVCLWFSFWLVVWLIVVVVVDVVVVDDVVVVVVVVVCCVLCVDVVVVVVVVVVCCWSVVCCVLCVVCCVLLLFLSLLLSLSLFCTSSFNNASMSEHELCRRVPSHPRSKLLATPAPPPNPRALTVVSSRGLKNGHSRPSGGTRGA